MKKSVLLAGILVGLMTTSAFAQFKYIEGRDYLPLATEIEKVEEPTIIEFFWYGCPHCYDMHGPLAAWVENDKSEKVAFETVPAMPSERWEIGGHLYYAAKALDLDIDDAVFEQVHKQHNNGIILDEDKAKTFLVSQGVDKEKVEKTWKSFGVKQEVARAKKLFHDSGLSGVPSFVINGSYEVPFQGNYESFFPKLEELAQSK